MGDRLRGLLPPPHKAKKEQQLADFALGLLRSLRPIFPAQSKLVRDWPEWTRTGPLIG